MLKKSKKETCCFSLLDNKSHKQKYHRSVLHFAMPHLCKILCVIYLVVGSQKIVFRDIPSVSDDRFPIMRKMMNTIAPLPANDPMNVHSDITISSTMKDVVQEIFTAAQRSEEKFPEPKTEDENKTLKKAQHSSSHNFDKLSASKNETIEDIFAAAGNFSLRNNNTDPENIPKLLQVDYSELSRIQNTIEDIFTASNTPRKLTPRQSEISPDLDYLDLLDIGSSIPPTADTGEDYAQESQQNYDYLALLPNPDNYGEDHLNSENVDHSLNIPGQTQGEENGSLVIKKCCRFNEVLNNNHECVESDDASKFNFEVQKLSTTDIQRVDYNMFRCQKKMIHELVPVAILPDGQVNVDDGEWLLGHQQCLELTEIVEGYIEGISLIVCDSSGSQGSI